MASGVPLPWMAKTVKIGLARRNGYGSSDDDVRMEGPGADRPPADEEVIWFTGHSEEGARREQAAVSLGDMTPELGQH